ncbi:MAG: redox-sensing transcriptional repressor Rex [Acutalibacteraceae bacterium]
MAKNDGISMSVIRRLPRYYRFILELDEKGVERISSKKLAEIMNVTASQIRQDFNCFGGFGQQGYGYSIPFLKEEIRKLLGFDDFNDAIMIGFGNLGKAVSRHIDFNAMGFNLLGIFEKDESKIGMDVNGIKVSDQKDLPLFLENNKPTVAILCLPKASVGNVLPLLYESGIKNYWNFSHYDIARVYHDTIIENVHMQDSLMILSHRIKSKDNI